MVAKSDPVESLVSKTANIDLQHWIRVRLTAPGDTHNTMFEFRPYGHWENRCERFERNATSSSQVWHSDANVITSTERPVAKRQKTTGTQISLTTILGFPMLTVFGKSSRMYDRNRGDEMLDRDVNAMIWGIFMSATTKAAVHLGQDHHENLHNNTDFQKVKHCSMFRSNWSGIRRKRYLECLRSNGVQYHG